jgi:hypothetical protein
MTSREETPPFSYSAGERMLMAHFVVSGMKATFRGILEDLGESNGRRYGREAASLKNR